MGEFKHKHSLGQNFLKDKNVLTRIVDSVDVKEDDLIIEVGPGHGALTKYLKLFHANLRCYEVDERVKPYLEKFLDDFAFPNRAKDALLGACEQVKDSAFFSVVESYKSVLDYDECLANIRALATERGVNEYTLILLYLVYIAEELKEE